MSNPFKALQKKKKQNGSQSKGLLLVSIFLLILLTGAISAWFWFNNHQNQSTEIKKPTVALVNEDHTDQFEGVNYQLGRSFVERVSNDNQYNWQVVSRAVADKSYADGSIQAVIYLPQNFTHNLLTLQSTDPQKAQIDYKVLNTNSKLSNSQLTSKINDILYQFNNAVVKMYYASVAGNVAEAQSSMKNVVNSQGKVLNQLDVNILNPFQLTNQGYGTVVTTAGGLKAANESWIQSQNNFTKSVTGMLDQNSSNYQRTLPKLTDNFNTQNLISKTNVTNANLGIKNQSTFDHDFYFKQYQAAYNQSAKALKQFQNTSSSGQESGWNVELKSQVNQFNQLVDKKQKNLQEQEKKLQEQQEQLTVLEKQLYSRFFAKEFDREPNQTDFESETQGTAGKNNAKVAIGKLLKTSFGEKDNMSTAGYQDRIKDLLVSPSDVSQSLSVNVSDYQKLFSSLEKNGSMSTSQKKRYEDELSILKHYAADFSINTPNRTFFSDIPQDNDTVQKTTKTITVKVPAGKKYLLNYRTNQGLSDGDVRLDSSHSTNGKGTDYSNPSAIKLDNSSSNTSQTYQVTYLINLKANIQGELIFDWGDGADNTQSREVFALVPENSLSAYAGGKNFGKISQILSNIDMTSSLVATLYGKPGATYQDILNMTDFKKQADPNSIFKMYGNIKQQDLESYLSDQDVVSFSQSGASSIQQVSESLNKVQGALQEIKKDQSDLENNLPNNYFNQILNNLDQWYNQATDSLDKQYKTWTKGETSQLEEKEWNKRREGEVAVYNNDAGNESLYQMIHSMVESSDKQSKETAGQAQIIKSNSDEFDHLMKETTNTQNSAKTIIDSAGNLLAIGNHDLNQGNNYYNNFSKLLSNTRSNKTNPNQVFNFFAQPIKLNNQTPEAFIKGKFDWRPLLLVTIGLLVGLLAGLSAGRVKRIFKRKSH